MLGKLIYARARIWLLMAIFVRVSSLLANNVEIDVINYRILESFEGCYLDEVSLYVPQKSIKEYSMTEPKSRFGLI